MQNSNNTNSEDLRIYQIIDANLDRAREGLRVLEDWARFGPVSYTHLTLPTNSSV